METKSLFKQGNVVRIPVTVRPGAFINERFISLESLSGMISGFVSAENVLDVDGDRGFIQGTVLDVKQDTVVVRIKGSFFTTTGLAVLSRDWAASHLSSG